MAMINPYLNFAGNTKDAFNFYKSVFGGEFAMVMRFKDSPGKDKLSAEDQDKMMHIALPIGSNILMATDALESMGHHLQTGNNVQISYSADGFEEGEKIFTQLGEGGKVTVPWKKEFWGDYFGMLTDKFGIVWMVTFTENKPQ